MLSSTPVIRVANMSFKQARKVAKSKTRAIIARKSNNTLNARAMALRSEISRHIDTRPVSPVEEEVIQEWTNNIAEIYHATDLVFGVTPVPSNAGEEFLAEFFLAHANLTNKGFIYIHTAPDIVSARIAREEEIAELEARLYPTP